MHAKKENLEMTTNRNFSTNAIEDYSKVFPHERERVWLKGETKSEKGIA